MYTIEHVHTEARENVQRYEEEVRSLESKSVHTGRILFYGNSFFSLWGYDALEDMLRALPGEKPATVKHGFGGATGAELWHYYPRLVRPCAPRALVWTEGSNDFYEGFTVGESIELAYRVFDQAREDFPGIRIIMLAPIDSPKIARTYYQELGASAFELKSQYYERLKAYAREHPGCAAIDIRPFFHKGNDAAVRDDFIEHFRPDQVHLTDQGYKRFAHYFKYLLIDALGAGQ